jgi:hypothetical protein
MRATQQQQQLSPNMVASPRYTFFERELKKRTHSYNKRGTEGESGFGLFFSLLNISGEGKN